MPRKLHIDRVLALISVALNSGGRRISAYTVHWDISGDCQNSFHMEYWGRPVLYPGEREKVIRPGFDNTPQVLEVLTRCRKCDRCLRARARRWYGAALRETTYSSRTWFGTLTLDPGEQFRALSAARDKLAKQGVDFDTLNAHEQFVARHVAIGPELTRYIKRVRKNSRARLRYLLVAEKHKSGDPHYHMLVHESADGGTVPHRILSTSWNVGFERWRLSDPTKPHSSAYLCKYLSKSLSARVRASQSYGGASSDVHAYVCQALQRLRKGVKELEGEPRAPLSSSSPLDPLFESLYFL